MKIINTSKRWIICSLLICFLSGIVHAQPAGNRIIEDTDAVVTEECSQVEVHFTVPMQYVSHFPKENGKELRIQFRPLSVNKFDVPALARNEHIRLMKKDVGVPLKRFEYEGEFSSVQPSLVMTFESPVNYKVEPGSNFRSISIFLSTKPLSGCKLLP